MLAMLRRTLLESIIQPSRGVCIHIHETMHVLRHILFFVNKFWLQVCVIQGHNSTQNIKVALHIDWALIFVLCESKYKFYVWFYFTKLMACCIHYIMRRVGLTRVVKYKRQDQDTRRRELDQKCKPARCLARSCKTPFFFIYWLNCSIILLWQTILMPSANER